MLGEGGQINRIASKKPPNSQEKGGWTKYVYTEAATYQYNDEGIRTVKIVNGVRHEYDVVGGQIKHRASPPWQSFPSILSLYHNTVIFLSIKQIYNYYLSFFCQLRATRSLK